MPSSSAWARISASSPGSSVGLISSTVRKKSPSTPISRAWSKLSSGPRSTAWGILRPSTPTRTVRYLPLLHPGHQHAAHVVPLEHEEQQQQGQGRRAGGREQLAEEGVVGDRAELCDR